MGVKFLNFLFSRRVMLNNKGANNECKKIIITTNEVQPIGISLETDLKKTNQIVMQKLDIENKIPKIEAILKK